MPIRKPNDVTIQKLQYELKEVKRTRDEYRSDNDALRNQNMMLLETLSDLTTNDEYWAEMSLKSGIVFRLKNILTQIKQMGDM